jgi:hypothetical protein
MAFKCGVGVDRGWQNDCGDGTVAQQRSTCALGCGVGVGGGVGYHESGGRGGQPCDVG